MTKKKAKTNSVSTEERTFLTIKEICEHTGIALNLTRQIIKDGEFKDFITIGKQNKVMVDRVAFEQFVKSKKHIGN